MGYTDQQLAAQSLTALFDAVTSSVPNAQAIANLIFSQATRTVRYATMAALPAYTAASGVLTASSNGALAAIDGVTPLTGDRVLVTPQGAATASDQGVYTVTNVGGASTKWTLTRAVDWATASSITPGTLIETGPEGSACPVTTFQVNNQVSQNIIVDTDNPKILAIAGPKLWKARVATQAALAAYTASGGVLTANANGTQTVDGVTIAVGDRVLLGIGAAAADNGLYVLTTKGLAGAKYVLTRAPECPTGYALPQGTTVEVGGEGTALLNSSWKALATTAGGAVLDTNDPVFYPRTASGQSSFSAGTTKTVANLFVFATTVACVLGNQTTAANNVMKGVLTAGVPGTGQLAVTNANSSSDTFSYVIVNWGG